jgi:hypothetical protein
MSTLEERVKAIEDERAILKVLYQYSHSLDQGCVAEDFVDLFTEDARWYSTIDGRWAGVTMGPRNGREDFQQWASDMPPKESVPTRGYSKHYVVEPDVRIDGDSATVESYLLMVRDSEKGPYIWSMGRYLDQLIRCPDGRWRIKERHLAREGAAPGAWVRQPARAAG